MGYSCPPFIIMEEIIFNFEKRELSPKLILDLISDIEIYSYYINEPISFNKKYHSPFRNDKHPSLSFIQYNDRILWRDWGDSTETKAGDVFSFVQRLFGCSFYNSLIKIDNDLCLNITNEKFNITKATKRSVCRRINTEKQYSKIILEKRLFNNNDILYWEKYGISLRTLARFHVFAIKKAWIIKNGNTTEITSSNSNPLYSYTLESYIGKCNKLYSPESKIFKWITNCPENTIQGYEMLPSNGELLIITKSLKDVMSLYEMGYNAIAPQSETANISVETFSSLKLRFDKILLFYDNDKTGIEMSNKFSELLGIKHILIPDKFRAKDISDYISIHGIDSAKKLINNLISETIYNNIL